MLFYLDDCQRGRVEDSSIKEDINVVETLTWEDHIGKVIHVVELLGVARIGKVHFDGSAPVDLVVPAAHAMKEHAQEFRGGIQAEHQVQQLRSRRELEEAQSFEWVRSFDLAVHDFNVLVEGTVGRE